MTNDHPVANTTPTKRGKSRWSTVVSTYLGAISHPSKMRDDHFARGVTLVGFSIGTAYAARSALDPLIHERMPYALFFASVAASTRWAGWRYGTAAAGLSLLIGTHFFAEPKGQLWLNNLTDGTSAILFALVSFIMIATMAAESAARQRVEERDAELLEQTAERQRLQEELEESRRLESIGRLAGGIAHDFNNLLTVVLGSAHLLRHQPENDDLIEGIQLAAQRGAELTKQLLGFARKQILQLTHMELNSVVHEAVKFAARLVPEDVQIQVVLCRTPWSFEGDPTQLQQVLLNLIVNARDALPKGGTIRIRTDNITFDERFAKNHPEVTPGEYVQLSVVDDGSGMSDELRRRIFEPFFTTKEAGTGLGLAMSYGIVKQLQGHISVRSQPDHGTTFDVYLPRARAAIVESTSTGELPAPAARCLSILLVEDDKLVREVTEQMLRRLGHSVHSADNGAAALALADKAGHLDLLVTDVVMPWMNGRDLYNCLAAKHPALAVVYVSGYTDNVVLRKGVIDPGITLVRKPFSEDELGAAIQSVMRASERTA
jgi:signal transduction histidine kinase/CheY-like chemotaxis protein